MPPKHTPIAEMGNTVEAEGAFRARVKHRRDTGEQATILGPRREHRSRAEADLVQIRAAGAVGNTREQGLQIMAAEARRIQVSAQFEAEVRVAVQRQRSAEEPEVDPYDMSDMEPEDEPWLADYPSPRAADVSSPPPSQKQPLTPHEADVALQAFRPIKARPEDLEHILACRADPNKPLTVPGDISPMLKVLTFARAEHALKMRQLLLDYGTVESEEERKRWVTHQRAAIREAIRIRESRVVVRDYDPCGAAMERNM
jgi:hypothetical protein